MPVHGAIVHEGNMKLNNGLLRSNTTVHIKGQASFINELKNGHSRGDQVEISKDTKKLTSIRFASVF